MFLTENENALPYFPFPVFFSRKAASDAFVIDYDRGGSTGIPGSINFLIYLFPARGGSRQIINANYA
jgi:hypothetical protein